MRGRSGRLLEKPKTCTGIEAIREIESKYGQKVDAIVIGEAGGMNGTYPLFIAANLDIPITDGDWSARAFPQINMILPNIKGKMKKVSAAISNGRQSAYFETDTLASLEQLVRKSSVELGGIASLALLPMRVDEAKDMIIHGTISAAEKMGKAIRESQGETFSKRLQALNEVLKGTDYKEAKHLFQGTITKVVSNSQAMAGFTVGGFVIEDPQSKEKLCVGYQNENLIAFNPVTGDVLAQVPNIISILDPNTMQPISCGEYRYGQTVNVITLEVPPSMRSDEALRVVGPAAFPMDAILELLRKAV